MSEEIGYSITIGGSITKAQWKRFYVKFRNGDYDYPNLDRDPGTNRLTDCGSCSYGDTSDLRALCRECGLAYEAQADAKYEYDGEFFCWFPGMAAEMEAFGTQDGRPAILIEDLVKVANAGTDFREFARGFEPLVRPVPPLLIGGEPLTESNASCLHDD
ncbi:MULTISPECIES: hypothetical protein [Methylobacterium]|jgi:hypothetical protein|uniref:HEPN/RES N-terminal domain-containing protein n=4 Tax=Pseudomonadota TaxID=1224 RepID=A0ABQ4SUT5_9HYPH|nr:MULTISPECIES: hypothetical protein [Methylobacterium]PIU12398.1 MAG: hypothetical protein COT28_15515 [Methylobacterium sp. CG08_land_8_20_14_0_20_71_15]GBU16913.1 hypothetical protein AwMethylo_11280 [Methylobacterium sp.]GJE06867.1 hypothetical protein AOPFMNJM_2189 [Methylobacterium jeotgali]